MKPKFELGQKVKHKLSSGRVGIVLRRLLDVDNNQFEYDLRVECCASGICKLDIQFVNECELEAFDS